MRYIPQNPGDCSLNAIGINHAIDVMEKNPAFDYLPVGICDNYIKVDRGALEILKRYYMGEDILFRSDYIATTLWLEEDIADRLQDLGYEGTQEEVDSVLNTGCLKNLGDCTDGDWQQIDEAIRMALNPKEDVA